MKLSKLKYTKVETNEQETAVDGGDGYESLESSDSERDFKRRVGVYIPAKQIVADQPDEPAPQETFLSHINEAFE